MTRTYKEYAEALFALALESDKADEFSSALQKVAAVFKENAGYTDFLACYGIPVAERTAALAQVFSDTLPEYVLSFLQLLCEQGGIKGVFDAINEYQKLYSEHKKVQKAAVISAYALDDSQKSALITKLEKVYNRRISPEYIIDKTVMGGIRIEVDGKVIDGTLRHRLNEVKEVIDI